MIQFCDICTPTSLFCYFHVLWIGNTNHQFIHSGYFYSASSNLLGLLLRGAPDYSIDIVPVLTHRSATGNTNQTFNLHPSGFDQVPLPQCCTIPACGPPDDSKR